MKSLLTFLGVVLCFFATAQSNFTQIQKAVASDRQANDWFGSAAVISGNYAVVGSPHEDHNAAGLDSVSDAGAVYIFQRTGSSWVQVQKIVANDRHRQDYFGSSVAISGNYVFVGAPYQDFNVSGTDSILNAGAAYVFKRNAVGQWNQVQKLVATDRGDGDEFGNAVCIADNYAIVGAYKDDKNAVGLDPQTQAGSAYVFERAPSGVWNLTQKLSASDRIAYAYFGTAMVISGSTAIISSPRSSSVHVIQRDVNGVWSEVQMLTAAEGSQNLDYFGNSLSWSGDWLALASYKRDVVVNGSNQIDAGVTFMFKRDANGNWVQQQKLTAGDSDELDSFGFMVALSGDNLIVSSPYDEGDSANVNLLTNAGSAYAFRLQDTAWVQTQKLTPADRGASDYFGAALGLSGNYAILTSKYDDENELGVDSVNAAGSVYFFDTSCDSASSVCQVADGLTVMNISTTSAAAVWSALPCAVRYRLRLKNIATGAMQTFVINGPLTTKSFTGLVPATQYSVRIRTQCDSAGTSLSTWSAQVFFTTSGTTFGSCSAPQNISAAATTAYATTQISWSPVSGALGYQLRYRELGSSIWTSVPVPSAAATSKTVYGLQSTHTYEIQLRAKCTASPLSWSLYSSTYLYAVPLREAEADAFEDHNVYLYPNPTQGMVTVEFDTDISDATISVYSADGRLVLNNSFDHLDNNLVTFDASGLPAGMYFVHVGNAAYERTLKFIKD